MNEQTAELFKKFLTANVPGDVSCDGTTIIHTLHSKNGCVCLPIIMESHFSIDEQDLHMHGRISFDVLDESKMKGYVDAIAKVINFIFNNSDCSNCACKGLVYCQKEMFRKFTFADGKISYPMQAVQLEQESELRSALFQRSAFLRCVNFEEEVIDAFCAMMDIISAFVMLTEPANARSDEPK